MKRPQSANSKRKRYPETQQNLLQDINYKTEYMNSHILSASRNNKNKSPEVLSLSNVKKVKMLKTVKTLAMVHAYQPQKLKDCLVKTNRAYTTFFSKDGRCNSNSIFLGSIISHFREWKTQIQKREVYIFQIILKSDEFSPNLQGEVFGILKNLREYGSKLKQNIEEVIKSGCHQIQISKLLSNYTKLQESLKQIWTFLTILFEYTRQLISFVAQRKDIDINDLQAVSFQLDKITKQYEQKISDSMKYCACQSESNMLLKIQFKIRQKMKLTNLNTLHIFESLKEMQQFETVFRAKIEDLSHYNQFSCEYLQNVIEFLYFKNEEIKINQKKLDINQEVREKVHALRTEIEAVQTGFIRRFRSDFLKDSIKISKEVAKANIFTILKEKGKNYLQIKKKWLLVIKVFQQSQKESGIDEQKYVKDKQSVQAILTLVNNVIKQSSVPIQNISEKINAMITLQAKNPQKNIKLIDKYAQSVKQIQELQNEIQTIVLSFLEQLCKIEDEVGEDIEKGIRNSSEELNRLSNIVMFSRSQQLNIQILKKLQGKSSEKYSLKNNKKDEISAIFTDFDAIFKSHLQFTKTSLQSGLTLSHDLKKLNKSELISYLFAGEFQTQLISSYQTIKSTISLNDKLASALDKITINNLQFSILSSKLLDNYRTSINNQIKNLQKSKWKNFFNKYVVFLYENTLIEVMNLKFIVKLVERGNRQEFKHAEEFNVVIGAFLELYDRVLENNRKQNSSFWQLNSLVAELSRVVYQENRFITEYNRSGETNQYFPSLQFMVEWIEKEFTSQIEQITNHEVLNSKRQEMSMVFQAYIKKLEALKQRIKMGQFITPKHQIYQDISKTINLLKSFTFQEQYMQLLPKCLKYLRIKNITHSALYSNDLTPIIVLPYTTKGHFINSTIFSRLHIKAKHLLSYPNIVEPYDFDEATDQQDYKTKNLNIQKGNFIADLFQGKMTKNEKQGSGLVEDIIGESIVDQFEEQIVEQQPISSQIFECMVEDALPLKSVLQKQQPSKKQKRQAIFNDEQPKCFTYWKIPSIGNIRILKRCLLYKANEFLSIRSKLNMQTLCGINTPQGRVKLIEHIDEILSQARQSDFIRIMSLQCESPQCEQKLVQFKIGVQNESTDLKERLIDMLSYFKFKRNIIYECGDNKIEAICKEEEDVCFVNIHMTENNYRKKVSYFQAGQFLDFIWVEIRRTLENGSDCLLTDVQGKVKTFAVEFNSKLKDLYHSIEKEVNAVLKLKAANQKGIEQTLLKFIKQIIKNTSYISVPTKISTPSHLLQFIDNLSKELTQIEIIEPFTTLRYGQRILYIDDRPIDSTIAKKCLFLNEIPNQFSDICSTKERETVIKKEDLFESIKKLIKREEIDFLTIRKHFFQENDMKAIASQRRQREVMVNTLKDLQLFFKLTDDPHYSEQLFEIQHQIQLLGILGQKYDEKQSVFESNRNIKYLGTSLRLKNIKILQQKQLEKIYKTIKQCKIKCCKLIFNNHLIGLLSNESIQEACNWLGVIYEPSLKDSFQITEESIKINKLTATFVNIIPRTKPEAREHIESYLSSTTLEVKTRQRVQIVNCFQLFRGTNKIEVDLNWPLQEITLKLYNPETSLSITLKPTQYVYFSTLEPLLFQNHFSNKFSQLLANAFKQKKIESDNLKEQQQKREQMQKNSKRKETQRQIDDLRLENERLKIILENKKITQEMIEMEENEVNKVQKKGKKTRIVSKEKEDDDFLLKIPEIEQAFKWQKSDIVNFQREDYLEVSLTLSCGHDPLNKEPVFPAQHRKKFIQEEVSDLQYQLTLSEHLADNNIAKFTKTSKIQINDGQK